MIFYLLYAIVSDILFASNSFPIVSLCSDVGNLSSTLILQALVVSTIPKYIVLKTEFSSNLVVLNISD